MLAFLKRLFGLGAPAPAKRPSVSRAPTQKDRTPHAADLDSVPGPIPTTRNLPTIDQPVCDGEILSMLDGRDHFNETLTGRENQILHAVAMRVDSGDLVLPHLPQSSLAAMEMTAKNSANVADIVELLAHDAVLSSEMLRVANSALYAGAHPCTTLRDAVVRLGMRATRSMIMSVSMKTMLLHDKAIANVATQVWRQSQSAGQIARAIGPSLGMDADRAFLIGLLHDIGKIALIETVRREVRDRSEVRPCLLGRVFFLQHERAGERIAQAWKLPEELVSVAGRHHQYERNEAFPREAALARLVHSIDLVLSIGGMSESPRLELLPEFDFLQIAPEDRPKILEIACDTFLAARSA